MANIQVKLTEPLLDGMDIKFRTPCNCTEITALTVLAPNDDGTLVSRTFTFKDSHGQDVGNLSNLFASNVLVKVMVDTVNNSAYVLNAGTNTYLETGLALGGKVKQGQFTVTPSRGTFNQGNAWWRQVGDFVTLVVEGTLTGLSSGFTTFYVTINGAPFCRTTYGALFGSCARLRAGEAIVSEFNMTVGLNNGSPVVQFLINSSESSGKTSADFKVSLMGFATGIDGQ